MNRKFVRSLKLLLVAMDFCSINVVFLCASAVFRHYNLIDQQLEYGYLNLYLNAAWLIAVLLTNAYSQTSITVFEQFIKLTLRSFIYFILLVSIYLFFLKMVSLSRVFIVTVIISTGVAFLFTRFIYLAVYQYRKKTEWLLNKVIVIGYNDLSKKLVNHLSSDINVRVIGYCEEYENITELSKYPILGNISKTLELCKEHGVTEIYSTIAPEHNNYLYELINGADQSCIRFKLVPDLGIFMNRQMHIQHLQDIPVVALHNEPLQDLGNRIKKRFFDLVISSLVIVFILSWLMPLISFLIWIESKGGALFLQQRSGRNNRTFTCIKFRSMYKNNVAHHKQATRNDARITRIGRFLRRTSLDELPQFINVFKGEMSISGPRPHMTTHTDKYAQLINDYMVRQFLKPGITGWAQVNGFRGETPELNQMKQRVEHDIWYMENWSLLLDLKIMFMTVINALRGEQNAF